MICHRMICRNTRGINFSTGFVVVVGDVCRRSFQTVSIDEEVEKTKEESSISEWLYSLYSIHSGSCWCMHSFCSHKVLRHFIHE